MINRSKEKNIELLKLKEYAFIVKSMLKYKDIDKINKFKKRVSSGEYMKSKDEIEALAKILIDELD